jgi:hypothetical protein
MVYLTLITALAIATTAAWYSIVGLMAIFAGAVIPIAIMGGVLEVGKLVTAAWLHQNWKKTRWWMKTYLTSAVFVLMIITSLGIFGFLSKAHLEHSISIGGNNELRITQLEAQIARQQSIISDSETVLTQLDDQVATLIEYDRIRGPSGSIATRQAQAEERAMLNENIDAAYIRIEEIQTELSPLQEERLAIEVEVGPLKYIAELIYGNEAEDYFDEAVRIVIILLIVTFDPLAVVLLLAATQGFEERRKSNVFYEDGSHRVDPTNVVDIENIYEPTVEDWPDRDQPNIVEVDMDGYRIVEDDIPEEDDMEVTGVNLEEDIDILPNETPEERQIRLEKYLYGEDERGVPKIGIRKAKDQR